MHVTEGISAYLCFDLFVGVCLRTRVCVWWNNHRSLNDEVLACCGSGSGIMPEVLPYVGRNTTSLATSHWDVSAWIFMVWSLPLKVCYCEKNL